MDDLSLNLSIAFFGLQAAAWAVLGLRLHLAHRKPRLVPVRKS